MALAALAAACAFGLVVALFAGSASASYTDTVSMQGTVTITPGTLHFTSTPSDVAFGSQALTGADQVVASNAASEVDVTDATGSGSGWTVSASAPSFTCSPGCTAPSGGTDTLGTLEINGAGSATPTSLSAACNTTCSAAGTPNHDIANDGLITVDTSTPTPFFDQNAGDGMGKVKITNVWWLLTIPYNAVPGSYSTTITLNTSSGPTASY
jgi:hypothetical protein